MGYIEPKKIMSVEVLKKKDYAAQYGKGISSTGIDQAIERDEIDYTTLGDSNEKLIVLTDKTKQWVPRSDAGTKRKNI